MSTYNRYYVDHESRLSPEILRQDGPLIPILIGAPDALVEALNKRGIFPQPETGLALIDTGASKSIVDESVIIALRVNPIGKRTVYTAGEEIEMDRYPAKFGFPGTDLPDLDFNSVLSSRSLKEKQGLIALIGRDILQHGLFIYHGNGHYTLTLNPNQKVEKGLIVVPEEGVKQAPSVEIGGKILSDKTLPSLEF